MMEIETAVNIRNSISEPKDDQLTNRSCLSPPVSTENELIDNESNKNTKHDLDLLEDLEKIVEDNEALIESTKQNGVDNSVDKLNPDKSILDAMDSQIADEDEKLLQQLEAAIDNENLSESGDVAKEGEDDLLAELSQPPMDDLNESFTTIDEIDGSGDEQNAPVSDKESDKESFKSSLDIVDNPQINEDTQSDIDTVTEEPTKEDEPVESMTADSPTSEVSPADTVEEVLETSSIKRKRGDDVDEVEEDTEPPTKKLDLILDDGEEEKANEPEKTDNIEKTNEKIEKTEEDEERTRQASSVTPILELKDDDIANKTEEQTEENLNEDNLLVDNNNKRRDSVEQTTKSDSDTDTTSLAVKRPISSQSPAAEEEEVKSDPDAKKLKKEQDQETSVDSLAELMKTIDEVTSKLDKSNNEEEIEELPKKETQPMKLSEIKLTPEPTPPNATPVQDGKNPISLQFLRQFNKEFTAMTRKDLENFLLQKVVEALAHKSEISELRQQVEKNETLVLSLRTKANELSKQLRDLEMVHQRVITDLEKQNKAQVTPVKITRAVGLQVSQPRTQEQRPRQVQSAPLNRTQSGGIRTIAVGGQNLAATVAAQQQQRTMLIQRSTGKTLSPQQQQQFMQRSQITIQRAPQTKIEQAVRGQQQYTIVPASSLTPQQRFQMMQKNSGKKMTTVKYTPMRPPLSNADQVRLDSQQKQEEAARLAIQQKRAAMQRSQQQNQQVQHLQMLTQQQQQQIQQNQNMIRMNITPTPPNAISQQRINLTRTLTQTQSPGRIIAATPQVLAQHQQMKPQPVLRPVSTQQALLQAQQNRHIVVRKINGQFTHPVSPQGIRPTAPKTYHPNVPVTVVPNKPPQLTQQAVPSPPQQQPIPPKPSTPSSFCVDLTDEEDSPKTPNQSGATTRPATTSTPNSTGRSVFQVRTPAAINQSVTQRASPTTTGTTSPALPQLKTMSVARTVATKSTAPPQTKRPMIGPKSVMQQRQGHPAPLPPFVTPAGNPMWKKIPPKPTIRINRIETGIVISWTMSDIQTGDEFANITSYQIYAYQETSAPPATDMWRHVGDVKAMPLPMAVTLTQFQEGERYFFSVRALDEHNRFGPFSLPKIWDDPKSE